MQTTPSSKLFKELDHVIVVGVIHPKRVAGA